MLNELIFFCLADNSVLPFSQHTSFRSYLSDYWKNDFQNIFALQSDKKFVNITNFKAFSQQSI